MNIKHNFGPGQLSFPQLTVGQVYLCKMPSSKPRIYMACTNPGHNGTPKVDFLVNMETGCRVVPAINRSYGFVHLPDAYLNSGV